MYFLDWVPLQDVQGLLGLEAGCGRGGMKSGGRKLSLLVAGCTPWPKSRGWLGVAYMPWPKLGDGSDAAQTRLGYQDARTKPWGGDVDGRIRWTLQAGPWPSACKEDPTSRRGWMRER